MRLQGETTGPAVATCKTCRRFLHAYDAPHEQCQECRLFEAQVKESVRLVEVSKLTLKPGDVLALSVDARLSAEHCKYIKDWLSRQLPPGIHALVLDRGMSLQVVEQQSEEGKW
jgi:hypothetical protein